MTEQRNSRTQFRIARASLASVIALSIGLAAGCNNAGEGALSGAALGALGGLAIGSLSGNAGAGAAIGAVAGGIGGAVIGDQNERNDKRSNSSDW
jgi:outer membrane lipoprotein SlyB